MVTEVAQRVLEERYFVDQESSWDELVDRVVDGVCINTGGMSTVRNMMKNMEFLPNSPTLMNSGARTGQLSACFALPVEDSMESLMQTLSDSSKIFQSGGGVGINFSALRERGSRVNTSGGVSSGPVSFMRLFNTMADVVKQGGTRRGAFMFILEVDHPDIMEFIRCKDDGVSFPNANISVMISDEFMDAFKAGGFFTLRNGKNIHSNEIWRALIKNAHAGADPGVLFSGNANRGKNPADYLSITNPCGEQWLEPYNSCNLGSINLGKFVNFQSQTWDYHQLLTAASKAAEFLVAINERTVVPIPKVREANRRYPRIGLGIMGLHDALIGLGVQYDSNKGRKIATEMMQAVSDGALKVTLPKGYIGHSTIAPTGTISMIADCSSGCEPYYTTGTVYKDVLDGERLEMPCPAIEKYAVSRDINIAREEGLFTGAKDICWEGHLKMQAALQGIVDSSISKTINLPKGIGISTVDQVYKRAYDWGCKGVTVYIDGTKSGQVMNETSADEESEELTSTTTVETPRIKKSLPEVLDAKRYRITDENKEKVYITVCTDGGGSPVEIFSKMPNDSVESSWSVISRVVSLALRYGIPVAEVAKQLSKGARSVSSSSAKVARILNSYNDRGSRPMCVCPSCNEGNLVHQGGCVSCPECGWEKCS